MTFTTRDCSINPVCLCVCLSSDSDVGDIVHICKFDLLTYLLTRYPVRAHTFESLDLETSEYLGHGRVLRSRDHGEAYRSKKVKWA